LEKSFQLTPSVRKVLLLWNQNQTDINWPERYQPVSLINTDFFNHRKWNLAIKGSLLWSEYWGSNSCVQILASQGMALGSRVFRKWSGCEDGAPAPSPREEWHSHCLWAFTRRWVLTRHCSYWHFSRPVETNLLFISHPLYGIWL
jgi:hypothetical protein